MNKERTNLFRIIKVAVVRPSLYLKAVEYLILTSTFSVLYIFIICQDPVLYELNELLPVTSHFPVQHCVYPTLSEMSILWLGYATVWDDCIPCLAGVLATSNFWSSFLFMRMGGSIWCLKPLPSWQPHGKPVGVSGSCLWFGPALAVRAFGMWTIDETSLSLSLPFK